MRHLKKGRKFGRVASQRRALLKSMAASFFMLGRIRTTEAKAKELRPVVEKFLTRAKSPGLTNRRMLAAALDQRTAEHAIRRAEEIASRPGGYTRIIKLGMRKTDGARMALIELVK